jgi:phosphoketolase
MAPPQRLSTCPCLIIISRYQLAIETIRRNSYAGECAVTDLFEQKLKEHLQYIREHLDDMPENKSWRWDTV